MGTIEKECFAREGAESGIFEKVFEKI